MRLRVKLYGTLRGEGEPAEGNGGSWVELPEGASVRDLLDRLRLSKAQAGVVVSVGRVLAPDARLRDGDVVSVFQPLAGG